MKALAHACLVLALGSLPALVVNACSNEVKSTDSPDDGGGAGGESSGGSGGTGTGGGHALPEACEENDATPACRDAMLAACKDLDEEACNAVEYCYPLMARKAHLIEIGPGEDDYCADPARIFQGCGIHGCGAALTIADDPSGAAWYFTDTCIPEGWTPMGSTQGYDCAMGGFGGGGP